MVGRVLVLLGTRKGAFILEGDASRTDWRLRGPFCETWPINHFVFHQSSATLYAGGGNEWFGPAVWKSADLGDTWSHSSAGLAYAEDEPPIKSVWSIAACRSGIYVGVEPAGLFHSCDGEAWTQVAGLRRHPSRPEWQPGAGGLILHSIVAPPDEPRKLWVAISAAGVFYTDDGGETWQARNRGTRCDYNPEGSKYPDFGQCVHHLAIAPGRPELLYQQNHCGMYRSTDGGRSWDSIEAGLPSSFGFPAAVHPRDPDTLFLFPLNGDTAGRYPPEARATVWRTRDRGDSWEPLRSGLPQQRAFFGVWRQAMATDGLDPAGVYFGTNTGLVYASADEGDTWSCITSLLPPITSVETIVTS